MSESAERLPAAFDPQTFTSERIAAEVSALGLECRPWAEPSRESRAVKGRQMDLLTAVSGSSLALGFSAHVIQSGDWLAPIRRGVR